MLTNPPFIWAAYQPDFSSDRTSGTIRLYDGRGDGKPLETIEKLHKAPVHIITVCFHPDYTPLNTELCPVSTVTALILSSQQMKAGSSNTGSHWILSNRPKTYLVYGHTRAQRASMSSRRYDYKNPYTHPCTHQFPSPKAFQHASPYPLIPPPLLPSPFRTDKSAYSISLLVNSHDGMTSRSPLSKRCNKLGQLSIVLMIWSLVGG